MPITENRIQACGRHAVTVDFMNMVDVEKESKRLGLSLGSYLTDINELYNKGLSFLMDALENFNSNILNLLQRFGKSILNRIRNILQSIISGILNPLGGYLHIKQNILDGIKGMLDRGKSITCSVKNSLLTLLQPFMISSIFVALVESGEKDVLCILKDVTKDNPIDDKTYSIAIDSMLSNTDESVDRVRIVNSLIQNENALGILSNIPNVKERIVNYINNDTVAGNNITDNMNIDINSVYNDIQMIDMVNTLNTITNDDNIPYIGNNTIHVGIGTELLSTPPSDPTTEYVGDIDDITTLYVIGNVKNEIQFEMELNDVEKTMLRDSCTTTS